MGGTSGTWAKRILAFVLALGAVALFFNMPGGEAPAYQPGASPGDGPGRLSEGVPLDIARGPSEDGAGPEPLEILYGFDVFDKAKLVGYSEHVFVGRIEEKVGATPVTTTVPGDPGIPHEQFRVLVGEVLKGGLKKGENRVVSQIGGVDPATGVLNVVVGVWGEKSGVDTPLRPGDEYLLCAERDPTHGWLVLTAQPAGAVPLTGDLLGERDLTEFRDAAREKPPSPLGAATPEGAER